MSGDRYARQLVLPQIGRQGQDRLLSSSVVLVGVGATGTVIANHLARAGVGRLRLIDRDWVEWNNLQRQLLFDEKDARENFPKAMAAEARVRAVNSGIQVEGLVSDLHAGNVEELIGGFDLVMDGTDNLETRYVINDACVMTGRPWVYCGAVSTYGMMMLIRPGETACLRCIFPEPAAPGATDTCDTSGVLGPAVGVIASLASVEAIKFLVGAHDDLTQGLVNADTWEFSLRCLAVRRRDDCPCCGQRTFPFLEAARTSRTTSLCGRDAIQITPAAGALLDLPRIAEQWEALGEVTLNPFLVRLKLPQHEMTLFRDGRAIVQGARDETVARSLYARFVGG